MAQGRYTIRIYDMNVACWTNVTVDDHIPCVFEEDWSCAPCRLDAGGRKVYNYKDIYNADGTGKLPKRWLPRFGRPKKGKVWALLLEKAMAKFLGCYGLIAGGSEPYALMAFTGFPLVYCLTRPSVDSTEVAAELDAWEWFGAQYAGRDITGPVPEKIPGKDVPPTDDEMWRLLLDFDARNYLMTASITRYEPPASTRGYFREDGLVLGHAYSLLCGKEVFDRSGNEIRLALLRNPHGEGEATADGIFSTKWRGHWSDTSPLWAKHPEIALSVDFNPANDGVFWISWDDFSVIFDKVCVLAKSMDERRGGLRAFQHTDTSVLAPANVGLALATMADADMWRDFRQLKVVFDPFFIMPAFLDDGSFEKKLCWEASKPGRLQGYLDTNRATGNEGGYNAIMGLIKKNGLERALGKNGYIGGFVQEDGEQSVTAVRRTQAPKRKASASPAPQRQRSATPVKPVRQADGSWIYPGARARAQ